MKTLKDVTGYKYTESVYKYKTEEEVKAVMQQMHKNNGGVNCRRLKDATVELRYFILSAYDSIEWEALGVRGVYYRVVSLFGLPKTEATYERVQGEMLAMRRERILNYSYVVDGSRHTYGSTGTDDVQGDMEYFAENIKINLWRDSRFKLEVTVEKGAMRDILMPTCNKYRVSLTPTSGFNSETAWYSLAERYRNLTERGDDMTMPVLIMLTDNDTAGLQMVESAKKAFDRFDVNVLVKHIGVLPEHIERFNLPTRTDKIDSDMRACELDAMTPQQAREILEEAILKFVDVDTWDKMEQEEAEVRETWTSFMGNFSEYATNGTNP